MGGQDRFRFLLKPYIKGAVAAFLMFDLTRTTTLWELNEWLNIVREMTSDSIPIVLIGSKLDMIHLDNVSFVNEEAGNFMKEKGLMKYIAISSKSGENVNEAMDNMVDLLLWQKSQGILLETIAHGH